MAQRAITDDDAATQLRADGHSIRNGNIEGVIVVTGTDGTLSKPDVPDGWEIWSLVPNGDVHLVRA